MRLARLCGLTVEWLVYGVFAPIGHFVAYFVGRPFHLIGDLFGRVGARIAYAVENHLGHFVAWLSTQWWRLAALLRLDVVQRHVDSLQDTAIRSVDELTMSVREKTTQSSWVRSLSAGVAALFGRIQEWYVAFMAWAEQSWLTRILTLPLRWLAHVAYTVGDFLIGWLWTRQYRHLLFGIPAILLVMPLAYCAVRLPFYTTESKARIYRRAVSEALIAEDYETANLYFRKLAQLGDMHEQVVLRSALLAEDQGQLDEAYRQMKQIAPEGEPGLAQAHLWIAQRISAGQIEVDNPRAAQLVEIHVNHALSRGESDSLLSVWLAQIYLQTGRKDKCLAALAQLDLNDLPWQTRVVAADIYAALGSRERARMIATGACEYFQQQRDNGITLTVDDYLRWAIAAELMGQWTDALDVLQVGLDMHPNHPRLLDAMSRAGLAYYDYYRAQTPEAWDARYQILQRLLNVLPGSEPVLKRLAELTLLPSLAERANQMLQDQEAATGSLPAQVEKTLGDTAVMKNDFDAARQHYQAALQQDPEAHAARK